MAPRDYYATVEGYKNKKEKEANLLRLSVFASLASWEGSISFQDWCRKFFPLWFDEMPDITPVELSKEDIQKIFKRHEELHKNNGQLAISNRQ
jgi:hypothetical protein